MNAPNSQSRIQHVLVVVGVILAVAAGVYLWTGSDVRLCRRVLAQLVNADPSVSRAIDWSRLQALEVNVGATYAALANRQEQMDYEHAFIRSFAEGFRKSGGQLSAFTHWRAEPDGSVSADYPAKRKTLVFRLSGSGRHQVDGIVWSASK